VFYHSSRRIIAVIGLAGIVLYLGIVPSMPAQAQEVRPYQYAVKFLCGYYEYILEKGEVLVATGMYATAINVHNPAPTGTETEVFEKIVVTYRNDGGTGPNPSEFPEKPDWVLRGDEVFEIGCEDVWHNLDIGGGGGNFVTGFVVIESSKELDVVAVYTTGDKEGFIQTMTLERVPSRKPEVTSTALPDLVPYGGVSCTDGKLRFQVNNLGTANAAASTAKVTITSDARPKSMVFQIPPVVPHTPSPLMMPQICTGSCEFTLTVDDGNVVAEMDETNNSYANTCRP
jgi:hypothetical protein